MPKGMNTLWLQPARRSDHRTRSRTMDVARLQRFSSLIPGTNFDRVLPDIPTTGGAGPDVVGASLEITSNARPIRVEGALSGRIAFEAFPRSSRLASNAGGRGRTAERSLLASARSG